MAWRTMMSLPQYMHFTASRSDGTWMSPPHSGHFAAWKGISFYLLHRHVTHGTFPKPAPADSHESLVAKPMIPVVCSEPSGKRPIVQIVSHLGHRASASACAASAAAFASACA